MIGNLHASHFRQCGKGRPPDYRFASVFVSYRYNAKVNFTEGRCPGSKAMNFDNAMTTATTVPNVTIADCDYTIAVWIRLLHPHAGPKIVGSSTRGKLLVLEISGRFVVSCRAVSTKNLTHMTCVYVSSGVVANNWTHIAVTCEEDNSVKIFFNGEIANNTQRQNISYEHLTSFGNTLPPEETFIIGINSYSTVMDLHILGCALPPDEIYDLHRG